MPLVHGKSAKAFEKNIKTEMHHGKPQKQALAIAYSIKRKAQHKAHGGSVEMVIEQEKAPEHEDVMRYGEPEMERVHMAKGGHLLKHHMAKGGSVHSKHHFAKGGHVDPYSHSLKDPKFHEEEMASGYVGHESTAEKHNAAAEHEADKRLNQHLAHGGKVHHAEGDIVGRILKKHHYSKGGVIANAGDAIPSHQADQHSREYDDLVADDHLESTQHDYGDELGDAREDHDRYDIVSKIMHSLKKKDRMPRAI